MWEQASSLGLEDRKSSKSHSLSSWASHGCFDFIVTNMPPEQELGTSPTVKLTSSFTTFCD